MALHDEPAYPLTSCLTPHTLSSLSNRLVHRPTSLFTTFLSFSKLYCSSTSCFLPSLSLVPPQGRKRQADDEDDNDDFAKPAKRHASAAAGAAAAAAAEHDETAEAMARLAADNEVTSLLAPVKSTPRVSPSPCSPTPTSNPKAVVQFTKADMRKLAQSLDRKVCQHILVDELMSPRCALTVHACPCF